MIANDHELNASLERIRHLQSWRCVSTSRFILEN